MRIPGSLVNNTIRILYENLHTDIMIKLAKMVDEDFDFYRVSGFRESIPINPQDCAHVIVEEVIRQNKFLNFVEMMIMINHKGLMGRKYPIRNLSEIIKGLSALGFIYDEENQLFFEDAQINASKNWGRLLDDHDYYLALLRLDIVHNTKIVRAHPKTQVEQAYALFYEMVERKIHYRWGRIWSWEGDGGMAAFFYGHRQTYAVYSALDIIQSLFVFNIFKNPLSEPIQIRLAVHAGSQRYSEDPVKWKKSDTASYVLELESKFCAPNELVISEAVNSSLEKTLSSLFKPKPEFPGFVAYKLGVEVI
jgi:class 3 adenylate cyclase